MPRPYTRIAARPASPRLLDWERSDPRLLDSSVDNRGEKWGQVARAVDKWHNVRAPNIRPRGRLVL